jgi:hypothetical protein
MMSANISFSKAVKMSEEYGVDDGRESLGHASPLSGEVGSETTWEGATYQQGIAEGRGSSGGVCEGDEEEGQQHGSTWVSER